MQAFIKNKPIRAWIGGRHCLGGILLAALIFADPVQAADEFGRTITAALPPADDSQLVSGLPRPLTPPDAGLYQGIFRLQKTADWRAADRLIGQLEDTRLLGHVLAQRYLHPKYKTSYKELREWLAKYGDLPMAQRVYRLALARQKTGDPKAKAPTAVVDRVGSPDKGGEPTGWHWQAGVAAWRVKAMAMAARQFELVATDEDATDWARAGGAFWAARAYAKIKQQAKAKQWLGIAAGYPRTFYGQLARRTLGRDSGLAWTVAPTNRESMRLLSRNRGGVRALALLQLGKRDLAEDELHALLESDAGPELAPAILALTQQAGLPSLSVKLAVEFTKTSRPAMDAALYPLPSWKPEGGFIVEPALLYALMRQESVFDPRAVSPAGATGLMQLMPQTAEWVAESIDMDAPEKRALFDPELNLTLAQRYVADLLKDPNIKGDLLLMAVAYNAGPGNLAKWQARARLNDDPLLFIEMIPSRETRQFIEHVLTNYWIYQERLGLDRPTLDSLAAGQWPRYTAPANLQTAASSDGAY